MSKRLIHNSLDSRYDLDLIDPGAKCFLAFSPLLCQVKHQLSSQDLPRAAKKERVNTTASMLDVNDAKGLTHLINDSLQNVKAVFNIHSESSIQEGIIYVQGSKYFHSQSRSKNSLV